MNYDGYMNAICCKYINNMSSSKILMDRINNIIPEKSDSSAGKEHPTKTVNIRN